MPLKEIDLKAELTAINNRGFVRTARTGDGGVGDTLEALLGLRPTNKVGVPDCTFRGIPTEIKAHRSGTTSMTTLFCKEPSRRNRTTSLRDLIRTHGYIDPDGQRALRVTISTEEPNPQGFLLVSNRNEGTLDLVDRTGARIWWWLPSDFSQKLTKQLVLVNADARGTGLSEEFWYRRATLYTDLDATRFSKLVEDGVVTVDLRAYIRANNTLRNHGTGFRIKDFSKLADCYRTSEALLSY